MLALVVVCVWGEGGCWHRHRAAGGREAGAGTGAVGGEVEHGGVGQLARRLGHVAEEVKQVAAARARGKQQKRRQALVPHAASKEKKSRDAVRQNAGGMKPSWRSLAGLIASHEKEKWRHARAQRNAAARGTRGEVQYLREAGGAVARGRVRRRPGTRARWAGW